MSESKDSAASVAVTSFRNCPDWGNGGRFSYDTATQTRTRIVEVDTTPTSVAKNKAPALAAGASKKENANG